MCHLIPRHFYVTSFSHMATVLVGKDFELRVIYPQIIVLFSNFE